ncbi:MAG: SUMF1/EgtB/PvdO family nonheme iron enzyme [Treponema sp.]|nr:SUMF1/EgtB/PvdO family nonheme iron enzyme [Treponema sp.]
MAGCDKSEEIIPVVPVSLPAGEGERRDITALALSADGEYLLSAAADGYMRIWEVYTGAQAALLEAGGTVSAAAFSPDSGEIAVGLAEGGIEIWDTRTDQRKSLIQTAVPPAALRYTRSGQLTAALESGEFLVWEDTDARASKGSVLVSGGMDRAALAGEYVLYAKGKTVTLAGMDGREIRSFPELTADVTALALDGGGKLAAAACADGSVVTWNPAGGGEFRSIQGSGGGKAAALSLNGEKFALFSGHDDGLARMWNLEKGTELVRYAGFDNGEWISIIAGSGYYRSSPEGSRMMSIQVGDETYSLDQLSAILNRPDKFYAAAVGLEQKPVASLAAKMKNHPPLVEILGSGQLNAAGPETVLRVKISTQGGGAGPITLHRNRGGKSIVNGVRKIDDFLEGPPVRARGEAVYTVALPVPLAPGNNRLGVSVFNETMELRSSVVYTDVANEWQGGEQADKPALHVLLTAIQSYKNSDYDLKYTVKDALALEELFTAQENGNLYSEVVVHKYFDAEVTKENVLKVFRDLQSRISGDDYFVFFFSGHGGVDGGGNFYFYPWDTSGPRAPANSYITKMDLLEGIANIQASRALILLDACQSGQMLAMQTAFDKLLEEMGQKAILTAAMGDQSAIETDVFEHGVFTQSILDGINGGIREGDPRHIGIKHLINFVRTDVPEKMRYLNSRTGAETALLNTRVIRADRKPLALEAPMQEPLGFYPDDAAFNLIDRYLEPGELTITSVSAGTVMILETEKDNLPIKAGASLVINDLPEDTYEVLITYQDRETETQTVFIENMSKKTAAFTHRIRERPSYRGFEFIEGGTFTMGSPASERGRVNDETRHQVTLDSFYIGTREISQREYAAVMGASPSAFKGDTLPVEQVSWFDAVNYCNRRSQNEGLTPAYTIRGVRVSRDRRANGYRLPTEAEWEYACRAGTGSLFSSGNSINSSYAAYAGTESRPVGQGRPNNWGLYDMHGNVWEWCWDWYGDYTGDQQNPAGPDSGSKRVTRGGGWYNDQAVLRSAYRGSDLPNDRVNNIGFRIVRPAN